MKKQRKITFEKYMASKRLIMGPSIKEATKAFFSVMKKNHPKRPSGKTFLLDQMVLCCEGSEVCFDSYLESRGVKLRPWQEAAAVAFFGALPGTSMPDLLPIVRDMKNFVNLHGNVFGV